MNPGRYATSTKASGGGSSVIGANEDMFLQAFETTPKLEIVTQKKMENELARVIGIISNQQAEWDTRVQAIKHFRSLVNSGIADSDDFHTTTLKSLEIPFQNNICDLRSQVVRETCITIAFLSCRLQQKFSRMAEMLLPSLIKLIPNSAKIISTSALVALRFIIQSTHNSRLVTIIKYQLSTSKSKDIHRALCEIVERIVTLWPPQVLERHLNDLQEVIRLGICDSDELARQYARRSFNAFAEHFREPADRLFNSLDQQRQRMLNNLNHGGGSTLSMNGYGTSLSTTASNLNIAANSASNHSVNQTGIIPSSQNNTSQGPNTATNIVSRLKNSITTTSTNGSLIAVATSSPSRIRTPTSRSTSAIDVNAQRRARARAVYLSSMYTRPRQLGAITPTPSKSAQSNNISSATPTNVSCNQSTYGTPASTLHSVTPNNTLGNVTSTPHQQQSQLNNVQRNNSIHTTPTIAQQQQLLLQHQQQHAASAEKRDGVALSKAASYLVSVINNSAIAESQIVTTLKYFNSLVDKHPADIISKLLPELMPPLVIGIDNPAICVRKASVFAMVAIHNKVGLKQMEEFLTSLTMTQRKLLEVYIKKCVQ